ncbi:hypothetical protein JCM3774_006850 [Rhodotorula dairenensis]
MHFVTTLTLVASASTLVSARLDRVRHHGDTVAPAHLAARAPAPVPKPFRLFPVPDATVGSSDHVPSHKGPVALKERDGSGLGSEETLGAAYHLDHLAGAAALAKRSAPPRKASKCHKKKHPSSDKTMDYSAGQNLLVSAEPKKASERNHRQHDSAPKTGANDGHKAKDTDNAKEPAEKEPDSPPVFDGGAKNKGLVGFTTENCGPSGATEQEPNGSEAFLACGISKSHPSSPWQVPKGVTLDNIKTVSLEYALATNPVWEPCKPFVPLFEKYGAQTGLPPILLAAFAMQESTCNPHVLGDSGGAFGLMQITEDKCGGRDKDGCSEPDYNVRTGAEYFKKELDNAGGSFLEALARYNGWQPYSMTYSSATAAAYSDCCECQNNLDYLYQMTNGWMMGKTGSEFGHFQNLAVCR